LRRVLASYLGITASAVEFRERLGGTKPGLHSALGSEIQFSLSHTYGLAVVAVAEGRAVGVDVEWTGRRPDAIGLARRFFTHAEQTELQRTAPELRARHFLALWTRREALAKLTGEGLPRAMAREHAQSDPGVAVAFNMHDLAPTSEHVGAIAIATAGHSVLS
jgi:4'-phosphopantetheinyl transferase